MTSTRILGVGMSQVSLTCRVCSSEYWEIDALEWSSSWFACYLCCILFEAIYSLLILTFTHAHANLISHITTRYWIQCSYASVFNQDIGSWDVSSVTDMAYMFEWVLRDALEWRSEGIVVCVISLLHSILSDTLASHSNIHTSTRKSHLAHLHSALDSTQFGICLQPGYWELGCL